MKRQRNYGNARILEARPLVEEDLAALREPRRESQRLKTIRDSHHNVARLLASGLKVQDVSVATGYSCVALARLQGDPSMIELIAHYRALRSAEWLEEQVTFDRQATAAMGKALRHINDHFDEADESGELIPLNQARAVAADLMDRFGYGKHTSSTNVNVDFAAKLEAAIARTQAIRKLEAE